MVFQWIQNRRRRVLLAQPFPNEWLRYLHQNVRHYALLTADEQSKLRDDLRIFIADKYWELAAGKFNGTVEVTDEMKVTIAAQACLLTLNIADHDYYSRVRTVLVYPNAFIAPQPRHGPGGVVSEGSINSGEAWYRGPIIISWADALAGGRGQMGGHNLVLHEFAHALDMMDGLVNGTPQLNGRAQYARWHEVMTAEYERLVAAYQRGEPSLLDQYGATNVGEFFAVVTECFFEQGVFLKQFHPALYEVLRNYYRQDPAERHVHPVR